jgi:hypothetical protein
VDPAVTRRAAAHRDHSRRRSGERQRQEPDGQGEGPEEVTAELQLEAVGRRHAGRRGHLAGIVDQQVDGRAGREDAVGELPDGRQVGQIDPANVELGAGVLGQDLGARLLALAEREVLEVLIAGLLARSSR